MGRTQGGMLVHGMDGGPRTPTPRRRIARRLLVWLTVVGVIATGFTVIGAFAANPPGPPSGLQAGGRRPRRRAPGVAAWCGRPDVRRLPQWDAGQPSQPARYNVHRLPRQWDV